ncbi:MAG: hypothetical protein R2855_05425 [Thermomicrobiales bacterium]
MACDLQSASKHRRVVSNRPDRKQGRDYKIVGAFTELSLGIDGNPSIASRVENVGMLEISVQGNGIALICKELIGNCLAGSNERVVRF